MVKLSLEDLIAARDIVFDFKKEGKFDEIRRDVLASIIERDPFKAILSEAEKYTETFAETYRRSSGKSNVCQSEARQKLRENLSQLYKNRCAAMIRREMGFTKNVVRLTREIEPRVDGHFGFDSKGHAIGDDHQVCDMDIESSPPLAVNYSLANPFRRCDF